MPNLSPEAARAALITVSQRLQSAQESLRNLMRAEPHLTAWLDDLARECSVVRYHAIEAGQNVQTMYAKVYPHFDFNVTLPETVRPVQPARAIGHIHVSPNDAGYPNKRTGKPRSTLYPRASWEEDEGG